jgi:hypothetical protein
LTIGAGWLGAQPDTIRAAAQASPAVASLRASRCMVAPSGAVCAAAWRQRRFVFDMAGMRRERLIE